MNLIVCIKEVPDTESRIQVRDGQIVEEGLQYVLNPYDEYALEEALRWQENLGGQVKLLCLGPERARESILKGLAMGADEAYHVVAETGQGDAYVTAQVLAAAIARLGDYDAIFCGKQAVDDDNAAVGVMLAELLDLPHVAVITRLEITPDGKSARAEREIEGGKEVVETPLPAVFTAQKGLNEPRYPSFKGIRMAARKPMTLWQLADLGLGDVQPGVELVAFMTPPARAAGRVIPGEPAEAAKEVARLLRAEAKVI